ncbi:MAG: T9SS type A sorting domain-containing protein, partial [Bacteroidota bacterium]
VNYTNFDICGFCNANTDNMDYVIMHSWNGGWSWSNFFNQRKYIVEIPCAANLNGAPQSLIALTSQGNQKRPTLESLVPNPAKDFVFVKIDAQREEVVDVQIFDARGTLVKTVPVDLYRGLVFKELDISELPSGMYFVKIPQGQKQHSQLKFVKQRF